jgi:hypothetical protein
VKNVKGTNPRWSLWQRPFLRRATWIAVSTLDFGAGEAQKDGKLQKKPN